MAKQKTKPAFGTVSAKPNIRRIRPIAEWIDFEISDDGHVTTGSGAAARDVYFLRFFPKNMSILPLDERIFQYKRFQTVLDSAEVLPSIFILDKTEGLSANKAYIQSMKEKFPQYAEIHREILNSLSGLSAQSDCVERAFYFVLRVKEKAQYERFRQLVSESLTTRPVDRAETIVLLRNFFLREYTPFPLLEFDQTVELRYESEYRKQIDKGRGKLPILEDLRHEETLRMLLPSRLHFDTRWAEQSGFYRKILTVRSFPASFEQDGVLRRLGTMSGVTLHIYLEPVPIGQSAKMMQRQLNARTSDMRSSRRASDLVEASDEQERLRESYHRMLSDREKLSYMTIFIEIYGETTTELADKLAQVNSELLMYGMSKDDLLFEQQEGFLSMLPFGENRLDTFARNMPHSTVAAMYPFESSRKVDDHGMLLGKTEAGSPLLLDLFLRTPEITNGNVLIIGDSGQGKSYTVKKILSQSIASGADTFTIDPENEYSQMYRRMECTTVDCGTGRVRINPLEIRLFSLDDDTGDENDTPAAFLPNPAYRQHLSWLRDFFPILIPELRGNDRLLNVLMVLTQGCYEANGIDDRWNPAEHQPQQYPTFSTLYGYIQTAYENWENFQSRFQMLRRDDLPDVLLALHNATEGAAATLVNGITNLPDGTHINFAVQSLMEGAKSTRDAVLFNVITYIWNHIIATQRNTLLTVDELYLMIDRDNPTFIIYLRNIMKRARKYNAVVLLASQNMADFLDPVVEHITSPLFAIPAHKFIFYPGTVDRAAFGKLLQLSPAELAIVRDSNQRHCLLISGNEKYHAVIGTLPFEAALFNKH